MTFLLGWKYDLCPLTYPMLKVQNSDTGAVGGIRRVSSRAVSSSDNKALKERTSTVDDFTQRDPLLCVVHARK